MPPVEDVLQAWGAELTRIALAAEATSFNTGCFLDLRNDHSDRGTRFVVKLLLYSCSQDVEDTSGLISNYRGTKRMIQAKANVKVLFVPSPETEYWVESIPMHAHLAPSGWLL